MSLVHSTGLENELGIIITEGDVVDHGEERELVLHLERGPSGQSHTW